MTAVNSSSTLFESSTQRHMERMCPMCEDRTDASNKYCSSDVKTQPNDLMEELNIVLKTLKNLNNSYS